MRPAARIAAALALALSAAGWARAAEDGLTFLSVGSGGLAGGYYAVASAICDRVNPASQGRLRCSPETTPGSRYNVDALLNGELELALAQSDIVSRAVAEGAPLRMLARLYDEQLTILVAPGLAAGSIDGLEGLRVDVGPPASGRRATIGALLDAAGLGLDWFGAISTLPSVSAVDGLCTGRIDAVMLIVGHPSPLVAEALTCGATLARGDGPALRRLVANARYIRQDAIPSTPYPEIAAPVSTLSVSAALIARADAPDAIVRAIVETLIARRADLAEQEALLDGLPLSTMRDPDGIAPLHRAAEEAYAAAE